MTDQISDKYFQTHLSLSQEDANELHMRYYKDYGLAIEGLVRHHKVDALEYNEKVDDALPLEDIMSHDPKLRKLLKDLDTSKVKPWLFTNAYINHGRRVVKLLGVEDMFEGITYCDYSAAKFLCKPSPDMFKKAMAEAGVTSPEDCYFVGRLHAAKLLCASTDINRRRLCYQRSWCDQDGLDCRPFG
jgi:pyrimidine and pyridine-specific 5'-nucleotidase